MVLQSHGSMWPPGDAVTAINAAADAVELNGRGYRLHGSTGKAKGCPHFLSDSPTLRPMTKAGSAPAEYRPGDLWGPRGLSEDESPAGRSQVCLSSRQDPGPHRDIHVQVWAMIFTWEASPQLCSPHPAPFRGTERGQVGGAKEPQEPQKPSETGFPAGSHGNKSQGPQ